MAKHQIDNSTRWYLAGPMTGIKGFNYPLFDRVAASLRADGFQIISPAELESPEARRISEASPDGSIKSMAPGSTWGSALARCMVPLADQCGGIVLLPSWWGSHGARVEAMAALLCGKKFAAWGRYAECAVSVSAHSIAYRLRESLLEFSIGLDGCPPGSSD